MALTTDDSIPRYRILNYPGFFGPDDTLYTTDTEIAYTGVPNEQMEPLNDAAKEKMTAYLHGLDQAHRAKMQAWGRDPNSPRPRELGDMIEQEMKDRPRVFPTGGENIPQMGNLAKPGQRTKENAKEVVSAKPFVQPKIKPVPMVGNMNQSDAS